MSFKPLFRRPLVQPLLSQSGNPLFDGPLDGSLKLRFDSALQEALRVQANALGLRLPVFIRLVLRIKAFGLPQLNERIASKLRTAALDFGGAEQAYAPLFEPPAPALARSLRLDAYLDMTLEMRFDVDVDAELRRQAAADGAGYHEFVRWVLFLKAVGQSHAASFLAGQVAAVGANVGDRVGSHVG